MPRDPENPQPNKAAPAGDIRVRALLSSDAEAIAELTNLPGFRAGTLRLPYPSVTEVRKYAENPSPGALNLVVTLDDKIVASGGLNRFSGRRQHVASIGMGVHDDFVGRGCHRSNPLNRGLNERGKPTIQLQRTFDRILAVVAKSRTSRHVHESFSSR